MRRREFVIGSGALSLAGAMPFRSATAQSGYVPDKIIDVHCHVFNADDLPLVDFIEKVFARTFLEKKDGKPYAPVAHAVLLDIAGRLQQGANDEGKQLDRVLANPKAAREFRDDTIAAEQKIVTELFRDWAKKGIKPIPARLKLLPGTIKDYLPQIAIGFVRREVSPGTFNGPKDLTLGSVLDNRDHAFTLYAREGATIGESQAVDPDYLATQIYESPNGPIGRTIKWAVAFSRYRYELIQKLHEVNEKRTILVTPALVDFSGWLDAPELATPIPEQVNIMERISRERPNIPARVHGFVPFDPLRQAVHKKLEKPENQSPLARVKHAVLKQGFVGVKLYPPMGFRASNNAGAGNDFPCWVRYGTGSPGYNEVCENPKRTADGLGDEPGGRIDAALLELFDWCSANNVPIMAHTNNSQSAGPGYGTRANPKYWKPILDRYPALRINFAHFGGFDEAYTNERLNLAALSKTWEWTIGEMSAANPQRLIFSDFSYFSELLDDRSRVRRDTTTCMRLFRDRFPDSDRVLLYGTDWSMIGHEQKFLPSTKLPAIAGKFLSDAGYGKVSRQKIFFDNAVQFLGLRKSDGENSNRGRLETFYKNSADREWLKIFDAVA